jgi:TPR repeat protein
MAADQNHASSQNRYVICLANGRGVVMDEAEAAVYFKLAADQNHPLAQKRYAI